MRSVRRSEKFVPFSSWEFYIFTQIDSARWLGDGYDESDFLLFKLIRLFKWSHSDSQVVRNWSTSALTLFRQNATTTTTTTTKKVTEPVAVPLDAMPERCTMTMKREISTRASLIPILRPGPLLLSDTCNPQQAVRERNVGPQTIWDRSLSYLQLSSADCTESAISIYILENIVIVSSMW